MRKKSKQNCLHDKAKKEGKRHFRQHCKGSVSLMTGFRELSNGFTVETPRSGNLLQEIMAIICLNLLSALKC